MDQSTRTKIASLIRRTAAQAVRNLSQNGTRENMPDSTRITIQFRATQIFKPIPIEVA